MAATSPSSPTSPSAPSVASPAPAAARSPASRPRPLARSPFPGPYAAAPTVTGQRRAGSRVWIDGSFHGVLCSDGLNPTDTGAWVENAERTRAAGGDFGPLWSWSSSACAAWPGSGEDAYRGPFAMPGAERLLVVSNRHDPATPLSGALALQELMPGSRLVTTGETPASCERC